MITCPSFEDLRNELDNYLRDVDEAVEVTIEDERPIYKNKSSGYIKLRNLSWDFKCVYL